VGVDVSVVIPTYNRRHQLEQTLAGLARQTSTLDTEVIVVSDGSSDGTDEWLRSGATPVPVSPCFQANGGPATARNRGAAAARGSLLLFLDDDVVPVPDLVAIHARHHRGLDDDLVVIGPMCAPTDAELSPWVLWEQRMLDKQYEAMNLGKWEATARQFYTANASLSRRHLEAVGGFDPTFRRAEDVELAYRLADAGLSFSFVPEAVVWHYADRSFESWLANAGAYGRNDVIFGRDLGREWLLEAVGREFRTRHPLVQALTYLSLRFPTLGRRLLAGADWSARTASTRGPGRLSEVALSVLYNLEYYRGMADELGGPGELLTLFGLPPVLR
jgi:GT2 family glycosyltransferase